MTNRLLSMLLLCSGIATLSVISGSGTLSPAVAETPASPMRWGHDMRTSLAQAHDSKKLLLVDVYKEECPWCKALDSKVYADPQVASYLNSNFVCVKVNAHDPTLGDWVTRKYDIQPNSFPAILMLRDKETVVGRINGYQPKEQFLSLIQMFATQASQTR